MDGRAIDHDARMAKVHLEFDTRSRVDLDVFAAGRASHRHGGGSTRQVSI